MFESARSAFAAYACAWSTIAELCLTFGSMSTAKRSVIDAPGDKLGTANTSGWLGAGADPTEPHVNDDVPFAFSVDPLHTQLRSDVPSGT